MDLSYDSLSAIPSVLSKHYRQGNINVFMTTYVILIHIGAAEGLRRALAGSIKAETLLFAFCLWPITGLGITAGAHRLWAHRSYDAKVPLRIFLMLVNSIANQSSILHWAKDHRTHHVYSETVRDPHNAKRGFFYAHIGWLLLKKDKVVKEAGKKLNFKDLTDDPVLMFQHRLDPGFAQFMCYYVPSKICVLGWGEDFWNAFFIAGTLRLVWVLHCTFLVNSAAHLYGDKPYDESLNPSENPIVSFFAIGEGWHNYHHKYPHDYSTSEFGISSQFNPTVVFIDLMAGMGQVTGRKRAVAAWEAAKIKRDLSSNAEKTLIQHPEMISSDSDSD
uniref:Fatty acid desaturase domain-containing protein n=1 Tax=Corethron hystrix TaxID=216773 RepID=A0A7S1BHV7_9STRA|mmetsp:Transcript_28519/g.65235  ORF Transcript_28519/g.65235 Transcript_28519/m.65235 type:complete len:332 (+) Transcript_28519:141-1136(+)|eukprot:CAMPEP_0113300276 /NCGR_PEP_ID=MMETSP0010_2-20120614/1974_1 /TAXON_ID=216773 ORGANISM="Corethron hystrix, Strain 308" /NCGR_SAMPLE_ID=MMETSP0010_2 /ASSEMBLY_ACC=CAM_ASM_000155 /LENGTH=331 /DNA_ID=CAMNT_0000153675 /DNA_START=141 /DNA_END=1136 /DNA_ORIENTATION=- /assembly_acc=CAM_ASM_000155